METNDFIISGMQLKRLIEKKLEPVMEEYNLRLVELDILVLLHREKEHIAQYWRWNCILYAAGAVCLLQVTQ